jgi:hypothetical protein
MSHGPKLGYFGRDICEFFSTEMLDVSLGVNWPELLINSPDKLNQPKLTVLVQLFRLILHQTHQVLYFLDILLIPQIPFILPNELSNLPNRLEIRIPTAIQSKDQFEVNDDRGQSYLWLFNQ